MCKCFKCDVSVLNCAGTIQDILPRLGFLGPFLKTNINGVTRQSYNGIEINHLINGTYTNAKWKWCTCINLGEIYDIISQKKKKANYFSWERSSTTIHKPFFESKKSIDIISVLLISISHVKNQIAV